MNRIFLIFATTSSLLGLSGLTHADSPYFSLKNGDSFKRFSISAGWLHVTPQGSANAFNINTPVAQGTQSKVGDVSKKAVLDATVKESNPALYGAIGLLGETVPSFLTGTANINSLSEWSANSTGLEAQNVDTLGIMTNYHFTDHVSLEIKAGIPPKVDIKGKGQITAPLTGSVNTALGSIDLKKEINITDLSSQSKAASARAWTPAIELHYQFGKTGVNKFRPYLGVGVMYAYFNDLKINPSIESDLVTAGHMIQNIHDGKAGAALDRLSSSANPKVQLDADDAWAPIVTAGFTYDFKPNWFAVASVSYAKLNNTATINVIDDHTGAQLINAKTKIDIDPILTYLGVGYRF